MLIKVIERLKKEISDIKNRKAIDKINEQKPGSLGGGEEINKTYKTQARLTKIEDMNHQISNEVMLL